MKLTLSLPDLRAPALSDALLTIVLSTAAFVLLCRNSSAKLTDYSWPGNRQRVERRIGVRCP